MFEQSFIERGPRKRAPWSVAGFLLQSAVVAIVVAVPLKRPDVIQVAVRPSGMFLEPTPLKSAPVEKRTTVSSSAAATVSLTRRMWRPLEAPRSWNHPVNNMVDGPDTMPMMIGGGAVHAAGPHVPGAFSIGDTVPNAPPPPVVKPAPPEPVKRLRATGNVRFASLVYRVMPVYPEQARQSRIQGLVRLEGIIAKDGTVQQLRVVSGHPWLAPAALEAVRQWRYRPTYLNGEPIEVQIPIDVNFTLSN
jgi:protein TonB